MFSSAVYISITIGDLVNIGEGRFYPKYQLKPAILLCMSEARTCIFNIICLGTFCVQIRWELAERFVDVGGIAKHYCLNEDVDNLVILFSCTTYLFRDSVVIHDIYWPDYIVLYDMHWPDYVVLYDALMISSYTTYIDIIISSYTTYIDLILSSYATYIDLIISSYATYIYLILSFCTILLTILCRLIMAYNNIMLSSNNIHWPDFVVILLPNSVCIEGIFWPYCVV